MKHLMIDMETLGTGPDACILSIGAIKFELDSDAIDYPGFYASVSIESNVKLGRVIEEDTLLWWLKQGPLAQHVYLEEKVSLAHALGRMYHWLGVEEDLQVWSNGADFDIPMITHAFKQCSISLPWKYYNTNCYRTYKKLPGAKACIPQFEGVRHDAMADAVHQVKSLQRIHAKLFGQGAK